MRRYLILGVVLLILLAAFSPATGAVAEEADVSDDSDYIEPAEPGPSIPDEDRAVDIDVPEDVEFARFLAAAKGMGVTP